MPPKAVSFAGTRTVCSIGAGRKRRMIWMLSLPTDPLAAFRSPSISTGGRWRRVRSMVLTLANGSFATAWGWIGPNIPRENSMRSSATLSTLGEVSGRAAMSSLGYIEPASALAVALLNARMTRLHTPKVGTQAVGHLIVAAGRAGNGIDSRACLGDEQPSAHARFGHDIRRRLLGGALA